MTSRIDLEALASRVEAAEAGSFDLDKAILAALGYTWRGMAYWYHDDTHTWPGSVTLTRSIDAALQLVPEGWDWLREAWDTMTVYPERDRDSIDHDRDCTGKAATPALAICAAALRARSAS